MTKTWFPELFWTAKCRCGHERWIHDVKGNHWHCTVCRCGMFRISEVAA